MLGGSPGQTVHVGSRTYELFYTGEQVRAIAWREAGAVYWIENTLTNSVSPRVMLAMAMQTVPVIPTRTSPRIAGAVTAPANVRLTPHAAASATSTAKLEALLGFVGLAVVALLAPLVLLRQREVGRLRDAVAYALALETRQRPLLAAVGIPYGEPPPPVSAGAPAGTGELTPAAPTVYRAQRSRRALVLASTIALALAVAIAAGVVLMMH